VLDTGNSRVLKIDSSGKILTSWGSRTLEGQTPPAAGTLNELWGIALDPQGNVYVADTWNKRVAVFRADGLFVRSWPVAGWNSASIDNKPFLAVDSQNRVYLADPEGYRILVYAKDGTPLAMFGQFGEEPDALNLPTGLSLDEKGEIWIADAANNRVSIYPGIVP
jgi:DNA-binding beta-propeller fold protein YncE